MNPDIAAALAEMDKINVSRLEHPGSWALDPSSCRFLAAFIRATGARRVLEFGSGFSTLMMAREIGALEDNFLLSIDSSPYYSGLAKEALENSEAQAKVEFRVAPLRPKFYGLRLVLIDAPHHDYGREAVFYDAFPAVAPGGYLILDDANREGMEKAYVDSWDMAYGDAIQPNLLEGIGNGLNVIEKFDDEYRAPLPLADSLLTSLKTLRNAGRLMSRREK